MNLQQFEYLVALDRHRNFVKAAQACFVTQPTLSMTIKKLEDELGIAIFERTRNGLVPTEQGEQIILRARKLLAEAESIREFVAQERNEISGLVRIGIIPTLAPYLLPHFLKPLAEKYPALKINIKEMITSNIVDLLKSGDLDIGLLAVPLHDEELKEHHLFYEEFLVYTSDKDKLSKKKYLLPTDIDTSCLWLLEEGHCLRAQIYNLCELKKEHTVSNNLQYEAGSIETLINLVDRYRGITIVPYLATLGFDTRQSKKIKEFAAPKPVREVGLVVRQTYPRLGIVKVVREEILNSLQDISLRKDLICKGPDPNNCKECTFDCSFRVGINKLEFLN